MNQFFFLSVLLLLMISSLKALGVPAGTRIINKATLNYSLDSLSFSIESNEVSNLVDQIINMKMLCQESEAVIVGVGEHQRAMQLLLSNQGNGDDHYHLTPVQGNGSDFEVENQRIYLDNGDGVFSFSQDQEVEDVNLSADANRTLFLVSDIPPDAKKFSINGIRADSLRADGLGYGESKSFGNIYVLMASRESAKSDFCSYEVSNLALELDKQATLSSDALYKGSIIHYSIDIKIIGSGTLEDVVISDSIPIGTDYIEGTLQLDGQSEGDFNGTAVVVSLGSISQNKVNDKPIHRVSFDVKVQ